MRRVAASRIGVPRVLAAAVLGLLMIAAAFVPRMPSAAAAKKAHVRAQRPGPAARLVFAATAARDQSQIYSIAPSGRAAAQLTFASQPASDPVPSPDGTRIAFERNGSIWEMRPDGRGQRLLARHGIEPVWTPNSHRLAYVSVDGHGLSLGIRVVGRSGVGDRMLVHGDVVSPAWSPDGRSLAFGRGGSLVVLHAGQERTVVTDPDVFQIERIGWSFDKRWLAFTGFAKVVVVRADGRRRRDLAGGVPAAWAPHRLLLAYRGADAVDVFNPSTGRDRKVTNATLVNSLAWSPRGDTIAASGGFISSEALTSTGDKLLVFTLAGRVRNLVRSTDPYALPEGVAWTRLPAGLHLHPPLPVAPRSSGTELQLREPVEDLVADGDRVAYRFCGTIGVWRPGDRNVLSVQADHPLCDEGDLGYYNLALAGDRVAWASLEGGNIQTNSLVVETVGDQATRAEVAHGFHTTGDLRGDERAGDLLGAGPLLVFSTWTYCDGLPPACPDVPFGHGPLASQTLWRVREPSWSGECPRFPVDGRPDLGRCQQLRVEPGPLRPLDVDAGRIVVSGDYATLLLDPDGRQLLSLPLSTQAAQLTGSDLVVLAPGELRDYDAGTGALLHTWPLPDVSSGGFCGVPARFCGSPRLRLEDAARGLVTYLLDGQIHLLRLSDGRDVALHAGTAARFGDGGLVYAYQANGVWPGRIRFEPFGRLPLQ